MHLKKTSLLFFTAALFLGGQGLLALSASCNTKTSKDHRCCLERRAQAQQVKKAPPCRHCFERASHAAIPQPVQNPVAVAAVLPKSDFPRTQDIFLSEGAFYPRGNVFLPKPDIPILLRQILI